MINFNYKRPLFLLLLLACSTLLSSCISSSMPSVSSFMSPRSEVYEKFEWNLNETTDQKSYEQPKQEVSLGYYENLNLFRMGVESSLYSYTIVAGINDLKYGIMVWIQMSYFGKMSNKLSNIGDMFNNGAALTRQIIWPTEHFDLRGGAMIYAREFETGLAIAKSEYQDGELLKKKNQEFGVGLYADIYEMSNTGFSVETRLARTVKSRELRANLSLRISHKW